jgi:rare lipoprotein A
VSEVTARPGLVALALVAACGAPPSTVRKERGAVQTGKATWYGGRFHGRLTASGEIFDQDALTAAHRTLPFHTKVRVTNRNNGRSVVVRINDRGPYGKGRVIDLSRAAARRLRMIDDGVVPVRIEVLELGNGKRVRRRR